jgi:hypothetical protein
MVGVNAPRGVITAVRKKGFAQLSPEEKAHLPPRVDTSSDEHRRLFRSLLTEGGHGHGPSLSEDALESLFRAQCAWDAVMAWNAVGALKAHREAAGQTQDQKGQEPGAAIMVVLLGSGHVAFGLGASRQAALAGVPDPASVIPHPASDDDGRPSRVRASYADYLWGIPREPDLPLFPQLGISVKDQGPGQNPTVVVVDPESAAARAGVQANDALLALDGVPLPDKETWSRLIATRHWGDAVRVTIRRGSTTMVVTAFLRRALPRR